MTDERGGQTRDEQTPDEQPIGEQPRHAPTGSSDAAPTPIPGPLRPVVVDRRGLVAVLVVPLALALTWRVGVFITDTNAIANTLLAVSRGSLAVTEITFPLDALGGAHSQPGLHRFDGRVYGRNYGQVVLALPIYLALQGVTALIPPGVALALAWSVGVLALAWTAAPLVERSRLLWTAGAIGSVLGLVATLATAVQFDARYLPVLALQVVGLAGAAAVTGGLYRLLRPHLGPRAWLLAVAGGLATPVGFWATIPKRHVLVAALVVGAVAGVSVARRTGSRRAHAAAYALAGLVAWIHVLEGVAVLAVVLAVDLATLGPARWRRLVPWPAVALGCALLPTLVTNALITGNPLLAPRLLPGVAGGALVDRLTVTAAATSGPVLSTATGGSALPPVTGGGIARGMAAGVGAATPTPPAVAWQAGLEGPTTVLAVVAPALAGISSLIAALVDGLVDALANPRRLWHVFVRSGTIPGVEYAAHNQQPTELTVLESAPLVGALAAVVPATVRRIRRLRSGVGDGAGQFAGALPTPPDWGPTGTVDALVLGLALAFTLPSLARLPVHGQFTVRYLLPVYPLGVYALARVCPTLDAVREDGRLVATVAVLTALAWVLALAGLVDVLDLARGETVQLHALLALASGASLAVVAVLTAAFDRDRARRTIAVVLGLALGVGGAYVLASGLFVFPYGPPAVPIVEGLAALVAGP